MVEVDIAKFKLPLIIIGILLVISFYTTLPVINMVILGAMLAYGVKSISDRIQLKVKHQSLSIFLAIIIVVIPLILLFSYILLQIVDFAYAFFNYGGSNFDIDLLVNTIVGNLPIDIQNYLKPYLSSVSTEINSMLKLVLNYVIDLVKDLPDLIVQVFILVSSIFYFARDGDKIWDYVFAFIPKNKESFFDNTLDEVANVLKSIFYGHFLTALIIGIIAGIGYAILGYKFALFLGILTGIFQLIPIFGPWPIYWALAIYDILVPKNILQAIITVLFGFVLSLSDMYIRPALAGKYADIHSLILLIGFMAGPYVFGIIGLILGPLILGITYAVIKSVKDEIDAEKNKKSDLIES